MIYRLAALASALVLISACSSGGSDSSPSAPAGATRSVAAGSQDSHAKNSAGYPRTVTFPGASATPVLLRGKDFRVVRQIPTNVDGGSFRYVGMLSDRVALGKKTPPAAEGEPGAPGAPSSESIVSVDLKTGEFTTLASHGTATAPAYIVSASLEDQYAVWVETHHASMGVLDWDLYTLDLKSLKVRKLASYEDIGIKDPPWPSPSAIWPQIVDGQVFFVAVAEMDDGVPKNAVFKVAADGSGKLTKVFDNAIDVFRDGDRLVFDRDGNVSKFDTKSGRQIPSAAQVVEKPCGIFFNEGVLVQCSQDGEIIITQGNGQLTTLTGLPGRMSYLNATSRWVGFSTNGKSYLYDLQRKRLGRLKNSVTFPSDRFRGNNLKYAEQGPDVSPPEKSPVIELLPTGGT